MNNRFSQFCRATRWTPLGWLLIASLLLSACTVNVYVMDPNGELAQIAVERVSADKHAHDEDAHDEGAADATDGTARLLVADGESGQLHLIDLKADTVIAEYEVAGPASLYTTESGRFAAVIQTDAHQVHFVDSGIWVENHGDHTHNRRSDPALLPFHLDGADLNTQAPVHFVSHHGWVTIHFDGNAETGVESKNLLLPENALLTAALAFTTFSTGPQHGASLVTPDGHVILSEPNPDPEAGTLPSGFVVYDPTGATVANFNNLDDPAASCVGMHGEAVIGDHYLFGCHQDDGGVLVITQQDDGSFTSKKITYPDGRRTSVIVTHPQVDFAVGQYGAYPTYNGLVRIDPAWEAIPPEAVVDLPANQCGFAFERASGATLVVLTEDGYLHTFDPVDWTLYGSLQVSAPFECFGETPGPGLAVGEGYAYVSNPATGEVMEIRIDALEVVRSWTLAGRPSSLALFGWYAPLPGTADADVHAEEAASENAGEPTAITSLDAWNGDWTSAYTFRDEPAMQAMYAAFDEAAPNHDLADVLALMEGMNHTSFDALTIDGETIRYTIGGATITCHYTFVGPREAYFGNVAFNWYLAKVTTGDEGCDSYAQLALTAAHSGDVGDTPHFHLRYGNQGFDDLVDNPADAVWYPTAIPTNAANAEEWAAGLTAAIPDLLPMLEMLPAAERANPAQTRLIVADPDAGGLTLYSVPEWQLVAEFADLTFADHPGYIVLPDGRVLFTTPENELIVLDATAATPRVLGRVTLPGAAIHLAVDPDLEFVAISTMADEESGEGATTLTQVNLATFTLTVQAIDSGEPGVLVGAEAILHRDGSEIGRLQSFPLAGFGAHAADEAPYVDIGAYGHGEALVDDHAYILTDDGVDIVHVTGAELEHEAVLPWNVSGREGGRGYYLRADAHGNLWSYLRIVANPAEDAAWANWQDWQNDAYLIDTTKQAAQRFELGPGLVYRMALSSKYALYSRLHPDGDEAILVDADPTSATFAQIVARIGLPHPTEAPTAGVAPWEAAGQRITGITPDGAWGFVSSGGDGVVHVIDTAAQQIVGQIATPTALDGGGYLLVIQPGQPLLDNVGR
jgi:Zn/Cd-binding protein ZinT